MFSGNVAALAFHPGLICHRGRIVSGKPPASHPCSLALGGTGQPRLGCRQWFGSGLLGLGLDCWLLWLYVVAVANGEIHGDR